MWCPVPFFSSSCLLASRRFLRRRLLATRSWMGGVPLRPLLASPFLATLAGLRLAPLDRARSAAESPKGICLLRGTSARLEAALVIRLPPGLPSLTIAGRASRPVVSLAIPSVLRLALQRAVAGTLPSMRTLAAGDWLAPLGTLLMLSPIMPQVLPPLL